MDRHHPTGFATWASMWGLLILATAACASPETVTPADTTPVGETPQRLVPRVVATHPHDPTAFTQGLELVDGRILESTGRYGESEIREVDRATGRVLRSAALDATWFGEGLTALGDGRAVQLTWKAGRAVVWDLPTLTEVDVLTYGGQGWGLCRLPDTDVDLGQDQEAGSLVMSDGSDRLTFRDLELTRTGDVEVRLDGMPVTRLNELECVDGTVWANVWQTDTIVAIDPSTGTVTAVVDASGLLADRSSLGDDDVLNGIAHDPETGRFLLTGKRWPVLFEVVFEPAPDQRNG
mgnify:FL=1